MRCSACRCVPGDGAMRALIAPLPITGFVGKNGSGKTLAMVERFALPSLDAGIPVLGNLTIFASPDDAHLPAGERVPHPLWVPLSSPWALLDGSLLDTFAPMIDAGLVPAPVAGRVPSCTVLLDEITTAFGSRESLKVPTEVVAKLQQLRKSDSLVGWTGPSWKRADVALREVTKEVVDCRGYSPAPVEGRRWPSNRKFKFASYDAEDFEEFSLTSARSSQQGSLRPRAKERYKREKHRAHLMYSTLETVSMLDPGDEYGTCRQCGGTRRRPPCCCVAEPALSGEDRRPAKPGAGPQPDPSGQSARSVGSG